MLDILIHSGYVITMQGKGTGVIVNGAVGIEGNRIVCVGDSEDLMKQYQAHRYIDAKNKVVMPGLIDAHCHASDAVFRGVAQDIDLWLERGIGPFQEHWTLGHRRAGAALHVLEGVKNGTTTFNDSEFELDSSVAATFDQFGVRARLSTLVNELPRDQYEVDLNELYTFDPAHGEEGLRDAKELINAYGTDKNNRISCMVAPQGMDMVSEELMMELKELALTNGTMIHIHLSQAPFEVFQTVKRYGLRPVALLEKFGLLNSNTLGAHLTENTLDETIHAAKCGLRMAFCPGSIGIIDGLVPPAMDFSEAGGIVGLGTDQAPGNNCINMFNEMKFASILNKVKYQQPTAMPAWQVMRMATIDAARAIGLEDQIGSLEPGKKADIILIDLRSPNLMPVLTDPVRNIVPNLVFSGRGNEVIMSIIDGNIIMEDRKVLTVNEDAILDEVQNMGEQMQAFAKEGAIKAKVGTLLLTEEGYC